MATRDSTLSLIVGGQRYGGWLGVRVTAGLEQACREFEITCTQRWPGQDTRFVIPEGATCEIWIGNDKIMTGYVDKVRTRFEADNASCVVAGRSKTCDLVDCSDDYATVDYAGLDLAGVARRIAAPFKIEVVAGDTGPVFPVAAAHHGETAFQLIERLARQRRLLVTDDAEGRLVLTQLSTERADDTLVYPSDGLKWIETERDMSRRFSVYKVKAQMGPRWLGMGTATGAGDGSDSSIPSTLAHVEGAYYDNGVPRYRPKTLLNEGSAKKEGVLARAEWEARRRAGRALKIQAARVGWRQVTSSALWRPNVLVPVTNPDSNVDALCAIAKVSYLLNEQGEIAELELMPPDALTPEPPETPAGAGGGGGRWADMGTALGPEPS